MRTLKVIFLIALVFFCLKCKFFTEEFTNRSDTNAESNTSEMFEYTSVNSTSHIIKELQNVTHSGVKDTIECNIFIVWETNRNIDSLMLSDVVVFLQTFSEKCRNNVEFSQFSNRVLFEVLEGYPMEVIKSFDSYEKINIDYILSELSNPIHDVNSAKIIEILMNIECESKYKAIIISFIEKAI